MTTTFFNPQGEPIWVKDADGFLEYMAYDVATGAQIKDIQDVNTADTSEFTDLPSGWSTPSGGGLNLVTQDVVDDKGRTTEETDPDGNVTYTVYLDALHEVRVYPGWNTATDTTTGPTQVYFPNETLTMSATPSVTAGTPNGTEAISDVQTLTVDVKNAAGQVTAEDAYFNLAGVTFAMGVIGTAGTNYYQTQYSYDALGNLDRTETPNGTIYRTVNDSLGGDQRLGGHERRRRHRQRPNRRRCDGQQHDGDERLAIRQRRRGRRQPDADHGLCRRRRGRPGDAILL